jgi:hypothetical protein
MWIAWFPAPLLAWVCVLLFRRWELQGPELCIVIGFVLLNPMTALLATSLRAELLFTAMLIGVFLLMEQRPASAGLLSGVLYLTRTAGICVLPAAVLVYLLRRKFREAAVFSACMLPAVIAWSIWVRFHQTPTEDFALLYYLDYVKFGLVNQDWSNIHRFLWINGFSEFQSLGKFMIVGVPNHPLWLAAVVVVSALMIAGIVRQIRRPELWAYAAFALIHGLLLLGWHFPPNTRFLYPILPLLAYGLLIEGKHFIGVARANPPVARAIAFGFMAVLGCAVAYSHFRFYADLFPGNMTGHRTREPWKRDAFAWIAKNLPKNEGIFALEDPVVFLAADRHSMGLPTPTRYMYEEREEESIKLHSQVYQNAASRGLRYVFVDRSVSGPLPGDGQRRVEEAIRQDARLKEVYRTGPMSVYRLVNR